MSGSAICARKAWPKQWERQPISFKRSAKNAKTQLSQLELQKCLHCLLHQPPRLQPLHLPANLPQRQLSHQQFLSLSHYLLLPLALSQ